MTSHKRNSSVELLRIIAMNMIFIGHASTKGGIIANSVGINNILAHFFGLANLGSLIFLIISFYFIIDTQFEFDQFFGVWLKTFFYGLLLTFVAVIAGCRIGINLVSYILCKW